MSHTITLRCPVCHRQAPVQGERFASHGRGKAGCSASGTPIPQRPRFSFTCRINTAAMRKTSVTLEVKGIQPSLTYEFSGHNHRQHASEFADLLGEPVYSGQALLERLERLETAYSSRGLQAIFRASLRFCLAVLQMKPTREPITDLTSELPVETIETAAVA